MGHNKVPIERAEKERERGITRHLVLLSKDSVALVFSATHPSPATPWPPFHRLLRASPVHPLTAAAARVPCKKQVHTLLQLQLAVYAASACKLQVAVCQNRGGSSRDTPLEVATLFTLARDTACLLFTASSSSVRRFPTNMRSILLS